MNYSQTLDYLYSQLPMFQRIGAAAYKADLSNTIALCSILGNPENAFRSVHIAGTNGKGSVSHLLASILQSAGYKTGLFTSPHLKDFRERIKVNGKMIPKSYVTNFVARHRKPFEQIKPSFFEYTAVMAYAYFKEEEVDIAVIETGMGGRLDSTNVITPLVSVITNISRDHEAFLGNTLEAIAREKAGIIKPGIPVVIGETQPETVHVFLQRSGELGSPIYFADQNFSGEWRDREAGEFQISKRDDISGRDDISITCPLKGKYQASNFITVMQVVKVMQDAGCRMRDAGFRIQGADIRDGFREVVKLTGIKGRWQILRRNPVTICDVGHNEAGIRWIIEQLMDERYDKLHWVFGMVNDKDPENILKLLPKDAIYYFCKANIPRGMDAEELRQFAGRIGLQGHAYSSVKSAYQAALYAADKKDLVLIGGSTFVVAEVL